MNKFMSNPISAVLRSVLMIMLICLLSACTWLEMVSGMIVEQLVYGGVSVEPNSFPFDASRKGNVLREKFHVNTYQHYTFTLEFIHGGQDKGDRLKKLVDAEFGLYLAKDIALGSPINITWLYFMPRKVFLSSEEDERNKAIDEAHKQYREALWSTDPLDSNAKYVYTALDKTGLIPLAIKLYKLDDKGNKILIMDEKRNTLGMSGQGYDEYLRSITGMLLRPGDYEMQVEVLRDSPIFFNTPMRLSMGYSWK